MRLLTILLLIIIPFFGQSQFKWRSSAIDSAIYYQQQMRQSLNAAADSVKNTENYLVLAENYIRLKNKQKQFAGFFFTNEVLYNNYNVFNRTVRDMGFSSLSPFSHRLAFGFSWKRKNALVDWAWAIIGMGNTTKMGEDKINVSLAGFSQVDIGYILLKKKGVDFYPFAGLAYRRSSLHYKKSGEANPDYTSLPEARVNDKSVDLISSRLGYQYGIGIDLTDYHEFRGKLKTVLVLKVGVNKPFKKDSYNFESGVTIPEYKPDIRQGDLLISIGVKILKGRPC